MGDSHKDIKFVKSRLCANYNIFKFKHVGPLIQGPRNWTTMDITQQRMSRINGPKGKRVRVRIDARRPPPTIPTVGARHIYTGPAQPQGAVSRVQVT